MKRTLGQKRAAFALEEVLNSNYTKSEEFARFCAGAPAVILQNGFGQAIAFWYSKGKENQRDKHQVLLGIIRKWLCFEGDDVKNEFITPCGSTRQMVEALSGMRQKDYLAAQAETLALLEWVKRYANALVDGE